MKMLALDIGGTAVKYGLFGEKEEFGQFSDTDADGQERLPERIMEFISYHQADCIGISVPGPFDYHTGTAYMEGKLKSLYHISLKELIKTKYPEVEVFFIHDAAAFILGALHEDQSLSGMNVSGVMLGTGFGYVNCVNGKVMLNEKRTPLHPIWNTPYKNGIAEQYVSAAALLRKAAEQGYNFPGVKEMGAAARQGDRLLIDIFSETGSALGELITRKTQQDQFEKIIIGGQVSKAWDLMRCGFEGACDVPYELVQDPVRCPLMGLQYYAETCLKR